MKTPDEVEQRVRVEWREKLQAAVMGLVIGPDGQRRAPARGSTGHPLTGPHGGVLLPLNGWDVHELYTVLVDPLGVLSGESEGCCAGCARLPEGWCRTCDEQRRAERSNVRPVVEWDGPPTVARMPDGASWFTTVPADYIDETRLPERCAHIAVEHPCMASLRGPIVGRCIWCERPLEPSVGTITVYPERDR